MNDQYTLYQQYLKIGEATFSRIDHKDAMVAEVYKITQQDGKQFILKICDRINDYLREVHYLRLFENKIPIPQIIQVVEPDKFRHGAILMECLTGTLLQSEELSTVLAYEIGCCLAKIHLIRLPGYGDPLQNNLSNDPRAYFRLKFEEGFKECNHHLPLSLLNKCRHYFDSHIDLLLAVDGPCVVHRDFRPGNLIVNNGELQGIIDWSGARASFAEEDFCSLEHGEWLTSSQSKMSFLEGYASVRPIPDYRRLISLLRLNKAIATIGFTVKRGTWNSNHATIYQFNRGFLEMLFANVLI